MKRGIDKSFDLTALFLPEKTKPETEAAIKEAWTFIVGLIMNRNLYSYHTRTPFRDCGSKKAN